MSLPETADFLAESEELYEAVAALDAKALDSVTQFKGWTVNDVLIHLHFWNGAAEIAAGEEGGFAEFASRLNAALQRKTKLRVFENADVAERGPELREAWIVRSRGIAEGWRDMDPKRRLPWIGPSMSARSFITARQMETWAHGFEIFDLLGLQRKETDRIRNIVVLGVNTFGWSHQVHGLPAPEIMPRLMLTAPSGATWEFGDEAAGRITGAAVDFAAVVTQTRALGDTALDVEGPVAQTWMTNAQCFAGPPETPPAIGSRHRAAGAP